MLCCYAQVGLDATDWEDDAMAADCIMSVCSPLYSQAGNRGTFGIGDIEDATDGADVPDDALGLVLVGAWARMQIGTHGGTVTARELAVLAGISAHHVRLLARQGELTISDGRIERADARRFLGARGVKGFEG